MLYAAHRCSFPWYDFSLLCEKKTQAKCIPKYQNISSHISGMIDLILTKVLCKRAPVYNLRKLQIISTPTLICRSEVHVLCQTDQRRDSEKFNRNGAVYRLCFDFISHLVKRTALTENLLPTR